MKVVLVRVALVLAISAGCAGIAASATFDRAVEAFERGDYRGAKDRAEEAIRRGQDSARVRILLGWSLYRAGDHGRAKTEFERALSMNPREPNAYFAHEGLGWIAYKAGDYDRALVAFAESLRLVPGYHNAHSGLGWAYLAKGDLVRADANFASALSAAPGDLDARRGLGFVAYHRGAWVKAIERFREVLKDNDVDDLTRSALAWSHYYKGDLSMAQKMFQDLARREPTWADPFLGQAWVAERQQQPGEAKALFRTAIERSATYVGSGRPGDDFRKLLASRPEWQDLWRDLAWRLYHERAFAQSEAEFRQIVERQSTDADAQRGLGFALYMLKRYREAIAPLERSLTLNPNLPLVKERVEIPGAPGLHAIVSDASSTLGWTYFQLGEYGRALRLFRDVTARYPQSADAWAGLGWSLAKSNDAPAAEDAFRKSLAAQPNYADALAGLQALGKAKR